MLRSRPSKLFELLVIFLVVLGVRAVSHADALGSINGSAAPGASVRIVCGSVTKVVTADGAGNFSASGLPAGTCQVTASLAGYGTRAANVTVAANGTATVRLALSPVTKEPVVKDPAKVEPKADPKPKMKPTEEAPEAEMPVAKRVRALEKRADKVYAPSPSLAPPPPPGGPHVMPPSGRAQK